MPEALRFEHPDERPVLFFLDSKTNKYPSTPGERRPHPRLSEEIARRLSKIILKYGGRLLTQDEREDTDVLIVDKAMEEEYALYYEHQPRPIVKTPKFIEECYKHKKFALYPQPKRTMGGQVLPKGKKKKWTPFTPQEKEMLCLYIAHKVPENDAGGRRGNKIYQDLVAHAEKYPYGPWALAANHTWQAWREHYVKKRDEYDPLIDEKAKEEGITSQSKGTYNFDRRKQYYHGVQEREIESEDDVDGDDEGNNEQANEAVAPVAEGPTRRRTRADSNEQDEAQGEDGDRELDQGPPPKRRRTDAQQRDSEEEDGVDWDPAEQTYQNRTARSSDVCLGPEDAGSSGSQPIPPLPTQETWASRSSVPAQHPPRPNPRHQKSPAADATPINTQQTLVGSTTPAKANMRARRANQIEEDEVDDEEGDGSPPPSPAHHATARSGRQRLRKVDVVVPLRQRTSEPQRDAWERSESAGSAEVEDMLPEGEEEEGNDPQDQEYVDEDMKEEDAEDGKDTQEAEELLEVTGDRNSDTEVNEMVERNDIEQVEEEDGDDNDETDSADQRALDSLNVEVSEADEAGDVNQHAFEAPSDEDDEDDNADIFGATPPAASSPARRFPRLAQRPRQAA